MPDSAQSTILIVDDAPASGEKALRIAAIARCHRDYP